MNRSFRPHHDKAYLDLQPSSIQSLQVLRGMAALAVVAFHTRVILAQREYGNGFSGISVAANGWLGVNFFFALSGFIILFAHRKDLGNVGSLPRYFWRRVSRLYPIYWIFLTVYIAAAAFGFGHPDFKWEFRHLFTAYTLVNIVDLPTLPLKVAWTLLFEVKFYLVFALVIAAPRLGTVCLWAWAAAILLRNSFAPLPDWGYLAPDWGMLSIWNIYFLFGMLACWLSDKLSSGFGLPLLVLGGGGVWQLVSRMSQGMDIDSVNPMLLLGLAVAFSSIIVGAVLSERRFRWTFAKPALLLGDASYAIYLLHSAVISLIAQLHFKYFGTQTSQVPLFFSVFCFAVIAGVVAHLLVERPLLSLLRSFGNRAVDPAAPNTKANLLRSS